MTRLFASLRARHIRRQTIRALHSLSPGTLQDLGIGRDQITAYVDGALDTQIPTPPSAQILAFPTRQKQHADPVPCCAAA